MYIFLKYARCYTALHFRHTYCSSLKIDEMHELKNYCTQFMKVSESLNPKMVSYSLESQCMFKIAQTEPIMTYYFWTKLFLHCFIGNLNSYWLSSAPHQPWKFCVRPHLLYSQCFISAGLPESVNFHFTGILPQQLSQLPFSSLYLALSLSFCSSLYSSLPAFKPSFTHSNLIFLQLSLPWSLYVVLSLREMTYFPLLPSSFSPSIFHHSVCLAL